MIPSSAPNSGGAGTGATKKKKKSSKKKGHGEGGAPREQKVAVPGTPKKDGNAKKVFGANVPFEEITPKDIGKRHNLPFPGIHGTPEESANFVFKNYP